MSIDRCPEALALTEAREVFRAQLLENDNFFTLMQHMLSNTGVESHMPEFGLQPTVKLNNDRTALTLGIQRSHAVGTEADCLSIRAEAYDYLDIGVIDLGAGRINPHRSLGDAVAPFAADDAVTTAAEIALAHYNASKQFQGSLDGWISQGIIDVHPMTNTYEVVENAVHLMSS